ncbi:MAG: hypothetical protein PVG30_05905 [Gammaproteobacteria bacterium]|jgi:hypothetical protein
MGSIKINNLVKKIYTKIKSIPYLPKTDTNDQSISSKTPDIIEKTSPINTSNILQQLEQIQTTIQPAEDELNFT